MKHERIPVPTASPPELIKLAEALARLAVKRDIAAARKEQHGADAPLRQVQ